LTGGYVVAFEVEKLDDLVNGWEELGLVLSGYG